MTSLSQNAFNVARNPDGFTISFEAFPPMNEAGQAKLIDVARDLEDFEPDFFSVTYGAGGSTRERTLNTLKEVAQKTAHNLTGHLTCVGATKSETNAVAEQYRKMGVNRIVALRGDTPDGQDHYQPHPGGYKNAADLVAGLKQLGGFDISVGAYPESHPDSPSQKADLDNLQAKFEAGADRAITQFFFDNHLYYDFIDAAKNHGINGQIVPGILLIHDFWKVKRFANMCQADVPHWLEARFAGLENDPQAQQLVAVSTAVEQVLDMAANGVRHFHFYTMNRSDLALAVCRSLGLKPATTLQSVA